jgi:hypothetical protein
MNLRCCGAVLPAKAAHSRLDTWLPRAHSVPGTQLQWTASRTRLERELEQVTACALQTFAFSIDTAGLRHALAGCCTSSLPHCAAYCLIFKAMQFLSSVIAFHRPTRTRRHQGKATSSAWRSG